MRKKGHVAYGIDIIPSETTDKLIDVKDINNVLDITEGFNAIIHTAAFHGRHMDLNYTRQSFVDTNITGTLNLLNACVANNIERFLFTSTTSIYGAAMVDKDKAVWVTEDLPILLEISMISQSNFAKSCVEIFRKKWYYDQGLSSWKVFTRALKLNPES